MANTTVHKRKHKDSQKDKMDMMAISKATYMLSDSYLYQIPTEEIERKNKQWLKKIKPKSHMTKKEYRRWKNKMKKLGVA